jgi:zinc transport system substrate-binding protein
LNKRIIITIAILAMAVLVSGCSKTTKNDTGKKEQKLTVMTTLFPYYDFVRAVIGDNDNIDLQLLVSPGQDDHSFEPTPKDIVAIKKSDIFIYNGGTIENWVEDVIDSLDDQKQIKLRMIDYIDLIEEHSEDEENLFAVSDSDEDEYNSDDEYMSDDSKDDTEEMDEHIWTSPMYACTLVNVICDTLCEQLPEYESQFRKNAENYINQIKTIDSDIRQVVNKAHNKEIIFADKFPIKYFAKEYGLKYYAAFHGCSGDTEPSAKTVAFLIDKVKNNNLKGVFYLELSSTAMADVICDDTGAKKYQFNSCHNITKKQFKDGVTYVDLMKENLNVLKKVLS